MNIGFQKDIDSQAKPKVLVMVDWFAPGFKAGGPIRSAVNFVDQLEHELDIYILTTDRDLGEPHPYPGIITGKWIRTGNHNIFYATPGMLKWSSLQKMISDVDADYIYLNSMFSRFFSIYPLLMHKMGRLRSKIILAPRGMLKDSAIQHKAGKKKIFIRLFKVLGIPANVIFQATDDTEVDDIYHQFGAGVKIFKAGNLPGRQPEFIPPAAKDPGTVKIVFIGRIHPIKNLDFLLQVLKGVKGRIDMTVIATIEDPSYWELCNRIIQQLPPGISVQLVQDLPNEQIAAMICQHHIFALLTKGENFGHSIFEALAAGRPVLISDQTPWQNLEPEKAGWVYSLSDEQNFSNSIQKAVEMDIKQLTEWCKGAWNYAHDYINTSAVKQLYLKQFR